MTWTTLQTIIRQFSTPTRRLISLYVIIVTFLTILRVLGISGIWWIDFANVLAPYWFLPMVVTFPMSVVVTRQTAKSHPPRWSVAVQIILIALGVYWFALPTIYKPIVPPTNDTIKVITYNVLGSNSDLSQATEWLVASDADIIFLQETSEGYDQRLEGLYDVYAHESHIEGSVRIFSRYEMLSQEILVIEETPGHLVLRVVLNHNGRQLATYATHFVLPQGRVKHLPLPTPNYGLHFALHYDETRRNAQIYSLLDILENETLPYIVAGDFNMSDSSLIYRDIDAVLNDAFRQVGAGAGRTWPVADIISLPNMLPPFVRIDYIWHTDDLRAVSAQVGDPIGSDHLPVTAVLEWVEDSG